MEPFAVFDCSLARCAIRQSCSNLRDYLNVLLCLDRPEPDVLVV
jgi:hypothetical protein